MKILLLALFILAGLSAYADGTNSLHTIPSIFHEWTTNTYYTAGEHTFELAPTMTGSHEYGFSMEYEYWQSLTMGTGIEIGDWGLNSNTGGHTSIDHMAIMEDYRLVYLPKVFLLDKFALSAKSAAETDFKTGSKGLAIGVGIEYNLFVKQLRIEISALQHFRTDSSQNDVTFRAGMQYIF